ncbi:MAG TPA: 1-acyl-sn-glycerol-3-phosphate acyltransferase [Actinomycetota bacterium]|nr:1-acyl-sn-glycerol-3-phosphate acyltransferase [Actinomycetota bacterium]
MTRGRLKTLLYLITRCFCRPLTATGRSRVPAHPVVFVANHCSHADTAALLAALPRRTRIRLAPAAAEDYFFKGRVRGAIVTALTGAFPFPRHGSAGLDRAAVLLGNGSSVLLYPEGTRSRNGSVGRFHCGVAKLVQQGATVVPVGIAGTGSVLPKGNRLPRRAAVAVVFGEPRSFARNLSPDEVAQALRNDVCSLVSDAQDDLASPKPTLYERVGDFARTRAAVWLVFAWAFAEALWWPVIPDFLVALLALAAPGRWLILAVAATAGSVLGGGVASQLGGVGDWLASNALLVTPRMHEEAAMWMAESGAAGLLKQPLSGIPYKVFALRATDVGLALPSFISMSFVARGLRIGAVAAIFAGGGLALQRVWQRIFGAFLITYCIVFGFGLAATIESWR